MVELKDLHVYEVEHNIIDQGTGEHFGSGIASRPAEVSDLVEALGGEVLKDATIRDKRGKYRNGDFLVVRLGEDVE